MLASLIYLQKVNLPLRVSNHYPLSTTSAVKCSIRRQGPIKSPSSLSFLKSTSKVFGLRSWNSFKATAMATYKVKLIWAEGQEHELDAPDDAYILESAENAGVELPYSCRAAGQMVSGSVDQYDGSFLDEGRWAMATCLLACISYPKSDCVILTHKESELYYICSFSVSEKRLVIEDLRIRIGSRNHNLQLASLYQKICCFSGPVSL